MHDGLLDVCVVGPVSRVDFLRTFPSVFRGDARRRIPQVRTWRGADGDASRCSTPRAPVELWASGEHAGPLPARIEPVAGALAVMVPARYRGIAYLTVSVPSMPVARWPGMSQ